MSRGAKIAIGIAVVLAVGAAIFFYLQNKSQNQADQQVAVDDQSSEDIYAPDTTTTPDETDVSGADQATVEPDASTTAEETVTATAVKTATPKASTSKTAVAKIAASVTPFPGSGPLDWTRNVTYDRQALIEDTSVKESAAELSGLSNSWSNPIEKFVYDTIDFFDRNVMEGLNSFACVMSLNALQSNVNSNLRAEYDKNTGECKIIDRP